MWDIVGNLGCTAVGMLVLKCKERVPQQAVALHGIDDHLHLCSDGHVVRIVQAQVRTFHSGSHVTHTVVFSGVGGCERVPLRCKNGVPAPDSTLCQYHGLIAGELCWTWSRAAGDHVGEGRNTHFLQDLVWMPQVTQMLQY
jgi:hypothetical protein